jgi:endonuclease/exonuclease/phosphatase (EEP) superfamily protein YafD
VRAAYPFATNAANATRVETLIFSKTPLTDLTEVPAERARRSWISLVSARLAFADGELTLIGDHLARPWPFTRPWVQGLQAEALATRFAAAPPARLLVGDLNGATWGHVVRTVAARGEARALGSWGTWPTWLAGALRLPIDHAITGPGIACAKKTVGPKTGSDHRPILVEFALEPAASAAPR